MLRHLIYLSTANRTLSAEELYQLLKVSRGNNLAKGITGMLLCAGGSYMQVLEGEGDAIHHLYYQKIALDDRHTNLIVLEDEPIEARDFPNWSMGFKQIETEDIDKYQRLNGFLYGEGTEGAQQPNDSLAKAKRLLESFKIYN
ncbi:MAG: BLUF domain-containing protein [Opitutales bacterium]